MKHIKNIFMSLALSLLLSPLHGAVMPNDAGRDDHGELVRAAFLKHWAQEPAFDVYAGRHDAHEVLRRLQNRMQIVGPLKGYELRTLSDVVTGKKALYFGGRTRADIERALTAFFKKHPRSCELPFISRLELLPALPKPEQLEQKMIRHYRNPPDYIPNQSAIRILREAFDAFRATGDDAWRKTFFAMVNTVDGEYDKALGNRKTPPSFTFHEFPWMVEYFECAPSFARADGEAAEKLMNRALDNMMDYWEMTRPASLYAEKKTEYLTNHYIFAARSVAMAADYMRRKHPENDRYKHMIAVSEHAMKGIAEHPLSPEDAAGYQFIVYRIFMNYALASGRYPESFFRNGNFKKYAHYVKSLFSHRGTTASYGDTPPPDCAGGWTILREAMELFGDREAEFLLARLGGNAPDTFFERAVRNLGIRQDLPEPTTLDKLQVFPNTAFREKFYGIDGLFRRPTLDKAVFRSGFDPDSARFMTITGTNNAPHGHFDANGISNYWVGPNLWLTEGDYILKYPDEHNTVSLNRNSANAYPGQRHTGRASQIIGQVHTPGMDALLALRIENYHGSDYDRILGFTPQGVWVIDRLKARSEGNYLAECRFRMLGEVTSHQDNTLSLKQNNEAAFHVTELTGKTQVLHSQLDAGHGGADGYYRRYKLAPPETRVLISRENKKLPKNGSIVFAHHLAHGKKRTVTAIAPDIWSDGSSLVGLGSASLADLTINAEAFLATPQGVLTIGARKVQGYGIKFQSTQAEDRFFAWTAKEYEALSAELQPAKLPRPPAAPEAPQLKSLSLPAAATAAAVGHERFMVGCANGEAALYDRSGKVLFSRRFPSAVTAIAFVGNHIALGYQGALLFLDENGRTLWERKLSALQKRPGTPKTIFPAQFGLVVGTEGWSYYGFTTSGKQLWRRQVYHGATVGGAADLDGDGKDEIVAGNEYYYHLILDQTGRIIERKTTPPWVSSLLFADLDGDGITEALTGRSDGAIYVSAPPKNPAKRWILPVGGRPIALEKIGSLLVAGTMPGEIVFFSPAGKQQHATALTAPLAAMTVMHQTILAATRDGVLSYIDPTGRIIRRARFAVDTRTATPILLQGTTSFAVLTSGTHLYMISLP